MRLLATTLALLASQLAWSADGAPAPAVPPARPLPELTWEIAPGEDPVAGRMVISGGLEARPRQQTVRLGLRGVGGLAGPVEVVVTAVDADGKPMPGPVKDSVWRQAFTVHLPDDGRRVLTEMPFAAPTIGWWLLQVELTAAGQHWKAMGDLAIIPAPAAEARPDSFFASNNAPVIPGKGGELTKAIGMKVSRRQVQGIVPLKPEELPVPSDRPLPLDMQRIDGDFLGARSLGITPMTVPGYSFITATGNRHIRTPMADVVNMYGPPRHSGEFAATWRTILERFPEIRLIEFWNEPWVFGWTWGGTAEEYRTLQTDWSRMALAMRPEMRILAGNSVMFMEDHIEPFPECWKGIVAGLTHHPYTRSVDRAHLRGGDQRRAMDYGWLVTKRMGLDYYYITEGGTLYREGTPLEADERAWQQRAQQLDHDRRMLGYRFQAMADKKSPEAEEIRTQQGAMKREMDALNQLVTSAYSRFLPEKNNRQNADKLPIYFTETALCGAYQGNAQWGIGVDEDEFGPNASFAVMTHLLEDRVPFAEIWPSAVLLGGAVYAMEADLPAEVRTRAPEPLRQRRGIPVPGSQAGDGRSIAVVWAYTGPQGQAGESSATLAIPGGAAGHRLKAFDVFGRRIPGRGQDLVVPFSQSPVYIIADAATPNAKLLDEIRNGVIRGTTAVNCYAQSLGQPSTAAQPWTIRLQSQHNRTLDGTIEALLPDGRTISAPFTIAAGALLDAALPWPGLPAAADNRHMVTVSVKIANEDGKPVTGLRGEQRQQMVQIAAFTRRTVAIDGSLADWADVVPVLVDSEALVQGIDLSRYHLNPSLEKPTGNEERKRVVAKVYTAYDDQNVYLAARVQDDALRHEAGTKRKGRDPVTKQEVELPYRISFPDGLEHPVTKGDCLQFAFGFRERVPGHGRQPGDPWLWKGQICDTDYVYNAHPSTEGPQLIRNWGPDTPRRNGYQTVQEPWQRQPEGSRIMISRDEASRSTIWEIAIPRSELTLFDPSAGSLRFGFIVFSDENVTMEWSAAAGVFDYWTTLGSYAPSWNQHLPCQTTFGIAP